MHPAAYDKSWLCPQPEDRERLVDMDRRLRPMRLATFGPIGAALLMAIPWVGWWPVPLMFFALAGFLVAGHGAAQSRRPEYRVAAAWMVSVVVIGTGCAATGGMRSPAAAWLAIPVVALAVRFRLRGIVAGCLFTVAIVAALAAFASGPTHQYPVIMPVGVVLALLAANLGYTVTLLRSDLEHRSEAVLDPLTGMLNRLSLDGRVAELTEQARLNRQPIAVILGDLDHFKSINDRFGHARGDAVLAETARRIRTQLRAYDLAYRLGGEEFLVLLPGADHTAAVEIAETLRNAIETASVEGVSFTMSFGVSACEDAEFDFVRLREAADAALYAAKRAGRNRVRAAGQPGEGDVTIDVFAPAA